MMIATWRALFIIFWQYLNDVKVSINIIFYVDFELYHKNNYFTRNISVLQNTFLNHLVVVYFCY